MLTPKQKRFVEEYLIDLNAKQAAIRTGYSPKTAEVQASRLLRNAHVSAAVAAGQKRLADKAEVTAERVIAELAKIGFANMQDYMRVGHDGDPVLDFSKLSREQAAALVECTVEDFKDGRGEDARDVRRVRFKLGDKLGALEKLGKHLGLFRERVELTGKDGAAIETKDVSARDLLVDRIAGLAARAGAGERSGKPH